jgi:DNA-binding SARP family transcriptional activator/tetratricopeptide (TPR) repeat protein
MSLEYKLLGPVEVREGELRVNVGRPQQRCVLAALLVNAGEAVPAEKLIDIVWEDHPPPTAHSLLYGHISRLRRVLGRGRRAAHAQLVRRGGGYAAELDVQVVDLHQFRHLVASAERSSDEEAAILLTRALDLWRGSPLSDLNGRWAHNLRDVLQAERSTAALGRFDALLRLGRHAALLADLRAWTSDQPLDERFAARRMLALYRSGRQGEAFEVFQETRRTLVEELGVEPGRELQHLHEQLIAAEPALAGPAATNGAQDDRFRTAAPVPGMSGGSGPHGWVTPAQLPHDLPGFVGREREMGHMRTLLQTAGPGARTVVLMIDGIAGVGKTTLAVHLAHQVAGSFPDGQLYVNLRGFDPDNLPMTPGDALGYLLQGLGIEPRQIPAGLPAQAGLYRSVLSGRQILVVLDNAATADQVRHLLPGTGSCAAVVTSRNRFGGLVATDGTRRLTLDVLTAAEALNLLASAIGTERVDAEPLAAGKLARFCGHLPMALSICAEHLAARPHLMLAELARRIADEQERLDLLATEDDAVAVRAALSWSYRALRPDAARLFRLLGLHPGTEIGTGTAAALADTDMPRARRLLRKLAGAHLLEETGTDRYRLHDLVSLYAAERAATDETAHGRDAALHSMLGWYLHSADAADSVLNPHRPRIPLGQPPAGSRPQSFASTDDALRWCEQECPNLVPVTRKAHAIGDHGTAWRLPAALIGYFTLRRPWHHWIATHEIGLCAAREARDKVGEAGMLTGLGIAYYDMRRFDDAIECLGQALLIWREVGALPAEGVTLDALGAAYRDTGQLAAAVGHFESAMTTWRLLDNRWGEAITLHNLGDTYRSMGRARDAIRHLRRARQIRQSIGDLVGLAWTMHDLGTAHHDLRRFTDAIRDLREALALRQHTTDRHGEARTLRRLGLTHAAMGDAVAARSHLIEALTIFEYLGDPRAQTVRAELNSAALIWGMPRPVRYPQRLRQAHRRS